VEKILSIATKTTIFLYVFSVKALTLSEKITHEICAVYPVSTAPVVMTQFSVPQWLSRWQRWRDNKGRSVDGSLELLSLSIPFLFLIFVC
jgi:hypothetical protein